MRQYPRRTNPGVRNGEVQKKNRTDLSPHYNNYYQETPVVDRRRPGRGFKHLLRKSDVVSFLELLPDWEELSTGLDAVVLAPGNGDRQGWYGDGVVAVCAWPRELPQEYDDSFATDHRPLLDRLGVATSSRPKSKTLVHWTEATARAFQLLHVLLHELGHHHDRMTTKSRRECSRGETYAEDYALRYADQIWDRYFQVFGGR